VTSKEQKFAIRNHIKQIYPFAYALIPDELQARQLVIDAFSAGVLEMNLENYLADPIINLRNLYQLARRRYHQVRDGIEKSRGFWNLDLNCRAALYLKYKDNRDSESVAIILGLDRSQVISLLHQGKKNFFIDQGFSSTHDFNFL